MRPSIAAWRALGLDGASFSLIVGSMSHRGRGPHILSDQRPLRRAWGDAPVRVVVAPDLVAGSSSTASRARTAMNMNAIR